MSTDTDENGNRKWAGCSADATERHIIRMSAFLVRRFELPTTITRPAAHELYNIHGFTLSRLQRPWGELTGDIIRTAIDNAGQR